MWPPAWQDGFGRPIEALTNDSVFSLPVVRDPNSGRAVVNIKSWLTDQAYTGGVGDQFKGIGPVTNDNNKKLPRGDRCKGSCVTIRNPWAAPGRAPSLGGGCGIFGGNPDGCPAGKDTRPPGSVCGQPKVDGGRGKRGTSSFGPDARLFDFPHLPQNGKWEVSKTWCGLPAELIEVATPTDSARCPIEDKPPSQRSASPRMSSSLPPTSP